MKKIILLLSLSATILISCKSNNTKELIVNKWRITNITSPNMEVPDSIKKVLSKGTLEFTKDGKFLVTGMGMDDQTGTYTVSENGKKLVTVTNGRSETNEINELTKIKIILTDTRNSSRVTAVPK